MLLLRAAEGILALANATKAVATVHHICHPLALIVSDECGYFRWPDRPTEYSGTKSSIRGRDRSRTFCDSSIASVNKDFSPKASSRTEWQSHLWNSDTFATSRQRSLMVVYRRKR